MDHLPRISNPQITLPQVPFLVANDCLYDGNALADFDQRSNFDWESKRANDPQASAFFQSWLYFGTLGDFLAVHNIPLIRSDFVVDIKGRKVLTTKHLWDYLAAWIANASRQFSPVLGANHDVGWHRVKKPFHYEWDQVISAAENFYGTLETACTAVHRLSPYRGRILKSVWDSTLVLLSTLENTIVQAYKHHMVSENVLPRYTTLTYGLSSRLLPLLFDQQQWCRYEKNALTMIFDSNLPVLLSCIKLNRQQGSVTHYNCTAKMCKAYQVDESAYSTKHVHKDCTCAFVDVGNVYEEPRFANPEYLEDDYVPAITYAKGVLRIVPLMVSIVAKGWFVRNCTDIHVDWVAISHIWAQGRGNPGSNALPQCQLAQLQVLANRLFPNARDPVPFWMDTLCIPLSPEARRRGIASMREIYKRAPVVLVLDSALMQITSEGLSPEEIALQIACSAWSRRLWTLQEGLYQQRVQYLFADGVQKFPDLVRTMSEVHAFPNRTRTLPKDHYLHQVMDNAPNCDTPKANLRRNAHKALSFSAVISSFFKQIDVQSTKGQKDDRAMSKLIRCMMTRTTSKVEDESVVFTNAACGLFDAKLAVRLQDMDREERYRAFFNNKGLHLPNWVPGQVIFLDQRRYQEVGSRWIPKSLLTQNSASRNTVPIAIRGEQGLAWEDGGIGVIYPGVVLEISPSADSFPSDFNVSIGTDKYACVVYEAGTNHLVDGVALHHPAIILQKNFRGQSREFTAVVVDIVSWHDFLTECESTTETHYTMFGSFSLRKYGKYGSFQIKVHHHGLARMRPLGDKEDASFHNFRTRQVRLHDHFVDVSFQGGLRQNAARLPRWLVL